MVYLGQMSWAKDGIKFSKQQISSDKFFVLSAVLTRNPTRYSKMPLMVDFSGTKETSDSVHGECAIFVPLTTV